MNKTILILSGILLTLSGILIISYVSLVDRNVSRQTEFEQKVRQGNVLLEQSSQKSIQKAVAIFSELAARKEIDSKYRFQVFFGLAKALEKSGEKVKALEYYKNLNQEKNLTAREQSQLSYSLGNLLLQDNKELEGFFHVGMVLKNSGDKKIRSNSLRSVARFYVRQKDTDRAIQNYTLALEENPDNQPARQELDALLKTTDEDDEKKETTQTKTKHKSGRSLLSRAIQSYSHKKYYTAIQLFKKASLRYKATRNREKIFYYLAQSYRAIHKNRQAFQSYTKVLENPATTFDQAALYGQGRILFLWGHNQKASETFRKVIENYPNTKYTMDAYKWRREALKLMALDGKEDKPKDDAKEKETSQKEEPLKPEKDTENEILPEGSEKIPSEEEDVKNRANVG